MSIKSPIRRVLVRQVRRTNRPKTKEKILSQLEINRTPTEIDLDAYNKILELSTYSMEVCKPKTKKNKDGTTRSSNHHIQARFRKVGEDIEQNIFSIGAMTLEANELYIGKNLNKADNLKIIMNESDYKLKQLLRRII